MAERLIEKTADEDTEDEDFLLAVRRAADVDELLRNHAPLDFDLTPGDYCALRGLWRGRATVERKEIEERKRQAQR